LHQLVARAFAAEARTEAYVMRINADDVLSLAFARKRAYEHASRALELDPEAALPFTVLAELQIVDGLHDDAVASARKAVAIAPGEAEAHAALSLVLTYDGRHAEAISAFESALRLDPRLALGTRLDASMSYMLNGQPENAVEMLEAVRAEAANVDDFHAMLAAAYALTGRTKDARAAAAEAARVGPNLSLELFRVRLAHFRRSEDLARFLDALEKAGLQKWPFGFSPGSRERLTAEAIESIATGRIWEGRVDGVGPGILQIDPNGNVAMRTITMFATGKAYVSDDRLCLNYESLILGRTVCGPIYRNPENQAGGEFPFTYANANMIFHFAPRE
jgi:tetratricopeptide (TPR) repeat protein